MTVEWPDRRGDVLNALELLAADVPVLDVHGQDPRWPGLSNAVHWLVDDTGWDHLDPVQSVGTILRNRREADAVGGVVAAVVAVSERQGPTAADVDWFGDLEWAEVKSRARKVLELLQPE